MQSTPSTSGSRPLSRLADRPRSVLRSEAMSQKTATGWKRRLLLGIGWLSVGLGTAGAALPLLPTTPFLILATACFVRSSPELHERLRNHRVVGPYLRQWERERTVPRSAKLKAYALVVVSFALSIGWTSGAPRIVLGVLGLVVLAMVARLPTERASDSTGTQDSSSG